MRAKVPVQLYEGQLRGGQMVNAPTQEVCKVNQPAIGWGCPRTLSPPAQVHTQEDEQHAHADLQNEGNGDEDHKGNKEAKAGALFNDSLQLGSIGHQQRNVQHALCCALLVGIMVYVDGPVPAPVGWLQGGDSQRVSHRKQAGATLGSHPSLLSGTGREVGFIGLHVQGPGEGLRGKCLLTEQESERRLCRPPKTLLRNQVLDKKGTTNTTSAHTLVSDWKLPPVPACYSGV